MYVKAACSYLFWLKETSQMHIKRKRKIKKSPIKDTDSNYNFLKMN